MWCTACFCLLFFASSSRVSADDSMLLKEHCAKCHNEETSEGDFSLSLLGQEPTKQSLQRWLDSLDRVTAEEMPPEGEGDLSKADRDKLIAHLKQKLAGFKDTSKAKIQTRRLNNREFENSIRDALLIEDIGTNHPTANLIGDSLHHGFDTHGETLGFSKFHLEQYIVAVRKIVDATILSGERPQARTYKFGSEDVFAESTSQNTSRPDRKGDSDGFDFLDPRSEAYFKGFKTAPETGLYRIAIECSGVDRGVYDESKTGIYDKDPIQMMVRLGDRKLTFDLPDKRIEKIELEEWLAAGSRVRLHHPTDGLRERSNGNFKFQNAITGEYLKENDPKLYASVVAAIKPPKKGRRVLGPTRWQHWVDYWRGPRPVVYGAEIEGPIYKSWPSKRQVALIGKNPSMDNAAAILEPIARRAWRRDIRAGELDAIVKLVKSKADELGDIEALKEGIVSILVSPQFLLLNQPTDSEEDRFATKLSIFLESTIPTQQLRDSVASGKLDGFEQIREELRHRFEQSKCDPFLKAFPYAWLELNDINFMAPDPDFYRHYHRKAVSEDMIDEALHFFRHAANENIPVPEFLSANYSFVNADLAKVYSLNDVEQDSTFRKYTFTDKRRGGLLGMGAFLTSTADSLGTSPIHRAIYVMENFMGIHPTPPPPDVLITEPDVRQAKTIKEILETHRSDPNCASCHQTIDPFGYAFENFDPSGAWRDVYTVQLNGDAKPKKKSARRNQKKQSANSIPIDASSKFGNGTQYKNIIGYRKQLLTEANRDRFVRCFITKLLTYANGEEPAHADFAEVDKILSKSAEHDYRMIETIAAVIDSPLFRER